MRYMSKVLLGGLVFVAASSTALADTDIGLGLSIVAPGVSAYVGTPPAVVYAAPPAVVYPEAPPAIYYEAPPRVYYEAPPAAYYVQPGVSVYYRPWHEGFRHGRFWHRRDDDDDRD